MIIRERDVEVNDFNPELSMEFGKHEDIYKNAVYFDLEHYVYKKPKCIGVFGACYYDELTNKIKVTQYMIENKSEAKDVLYLAKKYFIDVCANKKKKYIVTFSGNNDFTVINFLFEKYGINFNFNDYFTSVDIQKVYENTFKKGVGLKALEKKFGIIREGELISGSNLAKTFHKVLKDRDYFKRMPKEKIEKILIYNEQDVVNLFYILVNWELIKDIEEKENKLLEEIKENEVEIDETELNETDKLKKNKH
ncbi:MAG: ribonuclease H-like domain-containing protein [Sarcina sp.]